MPGSAKPLTGASLLGQGQVRDPWLRPAGPFSALLSSAFCSFGELRQEMGCLGGRTTLGRGVPFTESLGSTFCWAGRRLLEPGEEQKSTESWVDAKPKVCSQAGSAGGGATYGMPAPSTLRERQAPLHSLPSPVPFCSLQCLPGTVTGVATAWLWVASSSWHQGHPNRCPQGVTACRERHRGRR